MLSADLGIILPEIVLALYAMAALMGAVYTVKDGAASLLVWLTSGLFLALALWIGLTGAGTNVAFNGMFVDDAFARFAKVAILASAAAVLLMSETYMTRRGLLRFEYPLLIALAVVGMMMMVSAGDLMSLYMGLELQSLALYVVASLRRDSLKSTEAGLKYFVLGALSSGLLLYGASLVYGYAGTTLFSGIIQTAAGGEVSLGLLFGLVFLISGLAFKVSAVPFHMWTPDVYEGAPTPVTAFFATAPKAAAAALFARVLYDAFGAAVADWQQILAFLAVASMFLGSVAAIAHMGFALVGLAAGTVEGAQALLIYLAIYVTMNVGVFAFMLTMARDGQPVVEIRDLAGLSKDRPALALGIGALFFSLAGVPPLVGFFGKWQVFAAAVEADLAALAVAGAVASVIGAYYYLRIVKIMYFDAVEAPLDRRMPLVHGVAISVSALAMGLGWLPMVNLFGVPEAAAVAAASLLQ